MTTDFGSELRELRLNRGMSQQELAEALGVERQTISLWERGVRVPQRSNRQRAIAYFHQQDDLAGQPPGPTPERDISNAEVAAMIQSLQFSMMQLQQRVEAMRDDCCKD